MYAILILHFEMLLKYALLEHSEPIVAVFLQQKMEEEPQLMWLQHDVCGWQQRHACFEGWIDFLGVSECLKNIN